MDMMIKLLYYKMFVFFYKLDSFNLEVSSFQNWRSLYAMLMFQFLFVLSSDALFSLLFNYSLISNVPFIIIILLFWLLFFLNFRLTVYKNRWRHYIAEIDSLSSFKRVLFNFLIIVYLVFSFGFLMAYYLFLHKFNHNN